ncbi:MAG: MFS transporter, partial [Bacteroidales bacterium]|nr:MFS transporter [Bacteroidales bacterium]
AMGLQLAIARLGTAFALVLSPKLVQQLDGHVYTLAETARPATFGLALIMGGVLLWGIFVAMDARFDKAHGIASGRGAVKEEDKFKFSDIGRLLTNGKFLLISLLCVFFYCCIISFKKFGTSIVIPRFGMELESAKWVITMIPFFTVVFTPLFGAMVDKVGKATLWMVFGSVLVLAAHLVIAFAPQGVPFWGYFGIGMLGIGYSLVPSAMWPSVPKIVPERNLGTAYSLIYWIQNMGMLLVPIFVGRIFRAYEGVQAAVRAEWIFIGLGCVAVLVAVLLRKKS